MMRNIFLNEKRGLKGPRPLHLYHHRWNIFYIEDLKNKEKYSLALNFRTEDPRTKCGKAIESTSSCRSFSTDSLTKQPNTVNRSTTGDMATWVEQREHTALEPEGLQFGTMTWRLNTFRQLAGDQGGSGCPTAMSFSRRKCLTYRRSVPCLWMAGWLLKNLRHQLCTDTSVRKKIYVRVYL
jgi:hypothetical protein